MLPYVPGKPTPSQGLLEPLTGLRFLATPKSYLFWCTLLQLVVKEASRGLDFQAARQGIFYTQVSYWSKRGLRNQTDVQAWFPRLALPAWGSQSNSESSSHLCKMRLLPLNILRGFSFRLVFLGT